MKIGIITFHWATNYGAILQSYALQTTLEKLGHNVEIINYKPIRFDDNITNFFKYRRFLNLRTYIKNRIKEKKLSDFRNRNLKQSERIYTSDELNVLISKYDIVITGSDQVLNPWFLQNGEEGGSLAYFLGVENNTVERIAYAVSFGTTIYPQHLSQRVESSISRFKAISVRETSGIEIVKAMGRDDAKLVPDPTLLLKAEDYKKIIRERANTTKGKIFVYMLRNRVSFISKISECIKSNEIIFSKDESLDEWIYNIRFSKTMITNSFHGVVFCLHFHIPFIVVLENKENIGMNDRFFTILDKCKLLGRIVTEDDFSADIINSEIDWDKVDLEIKELRNVGINFLLKNIN